MEDEEAEEDVAYVPRAGLDFDGFFKSSAVYLSAGPSRVSRRCWCAAAGGLGGGVCFGPAAPVASLRMWRARELPPPLPLCGVRFMVAGADDERNCGAQHIHIGFFSSCCHF